MNKLLREVVKLDMALEPQQVTVVGAVPAVSRYFPVGRERKALFHVLLQALAGLEQGDMVDIGIVDDSVGVLIPAATGDLAALVVAANPAVRVFQHITAGVGATVVTIDSTVFAPTCSITINGVVFPYNVAPVLPGEWDDGAALAAQINALLPGLFAVDALGIVTIISAVPGEQTITLTDPVIFVAADLLTLQAQALMEVDASELVPGATTLAVVVDNLAGNADDIEIAAALARGDARYAPVPQAVA